MPSVTARLFDEAGNFLSHLPLVGEVEIQEVLNEEGAGRLRYSASGAGADLLTSIHDGMIAVYIDGYERFRFLVEEDEDDEADAAGPAREITVAGPGILAALARAVVIPQNGIGTKPAQWAFTDATPGEILRGLIGAVKAEGYLPHVWVDFTVDKDSAGQPWQKQMTVTYDAGKDLLTVAKDIAAQGLCDLRMVPGPQQGDGVWLQAYNPDTVMAQDRPNVYIRRAHVTRAPKKRSRRELRTDMLVVGEDGVNVLRRDVEARNRYGPRLGYLGWGNANKVPALNTAGDNALQLASRPQVGYDFDLQLDHPTCPQPYRDFKIGEKIRSDYAPTEVGTGYEPLRVRQMTVTLNRDGVVNATIGCNDRFLEASLKLARKIEGVVHGTISNTGVGPPSKPPQDRTPPAPPTGVTVVPNVYTGPDGRSSVAVAVGWQEVTSNVDGSPFDDFGGYRVSYRLPDRSQTWVGETTTTGLEVVIEGLPQGERFQARVRAFDGNGNASEFGYSPLITLPVDPGPPPPPSQPLLASRLGTLRVTWDGFDADGAAMPRDLSHVEVHVSTTPGFEPSPSTRMDTITGAPGIAVLTDLEYNTVYWVRLVAVDNVGNRSLPSAEASAEIIPLVDTDIIGQVLDGANIIPGTVVASDAIVANTITGGLIQALAIETGHLAANAVTADKIQAGAITTEKLASGAVTADKIEARSITADKLTFGTTLNLHPDPSFESETYRARYPATGRWAWEQSASSADGMWRLKGTPDGTTTGFVLAEIPVVRGERYYLSIWMKCDGATNGRSQLLVVFYNRDGQSIGSTAAGFATYQIGNVWTKVEGTVLVPFGAASMSVRVDQSGGASTGTWWWDLIEIRPVMGTTTTGGVSRVEISPLGVFMWDAASRQTVKMDATTGDVSVVGAIATGLAPDRRLVINPDNTGLAEIRFYPANDSRYAFINSYDTVYGTPALGMNGALLGDGGGMSVLLADQEWDIGRIDRQTLLPAGSGVKGFRDEVHFLGELTRWPTWANTLIFGGQEPFQVGTFGFAVSFGITLDDPLPGFLITPFRGNATAADQVNWIVYQRSATTFSVRVTKPDGTTPTVNYNFAWVAFRDFAS